MVASKAHAFNPDPNLKIKKKFLSAAKSHAEQRDVDAELTGEMLQKIYAGPKSIDFDKIYVKSVVSKTF